MLRQKRKNDNSKKGEDVNVDSEDDVHFRCVS